MLMSSFDVDSQGFGVGKAFCVVASVNFAMHSFVCTCTVSCKATCMADVKARWAGEFRGWAQSREANNVKLPRTEGASNMCALLCRFADPSASPRPWLSFIC